MITWMLILASSGAALYDPDLEAERAAKLGPGFAYCAQVHREMPGFLRHPEGDDQWRLWCEAVRQCKPRNAEEICDPLWVKDTATEPMAALAARERRATLALTLPSPWAERLLYVGSFHRLAAAPITPEIELAKWRFYRRLLDAKTADGVPVGSLDGLLPSLNADIRGPLDPAIDDPTPLPSKTPLLTRDPLALNGGFHALPPSEHRHFIDILSEPGDIEWIREFFLRPEIAPDPGVRKYAAETIKEILARPVCPWIGRPRKCPVPTEPPRKHIASEEPEPPPKP